jgi:RNA ligase (TIGR02306 family)
MSTTLITVERVTEVEHHPNADRLDIITVLGYKVITGRDQFKVDDTAIYFPADILITPNVAEELGVIKYLKHAIYPGDIAKTQCRVSACRLRGVPSHGFVTGPLGPGPCECGKDLTGTYGGIKYEPPVRLGGGNAARSLTAFHSYTDIENVQRYPNLIPEGVAVRVTEKLHGTNCRLGLVLDDGEFKLVAGSHKVRRTSGEGLYWEPMDEAVMNLLTELCDEKHSVVVFGEIFGPGIQDLDYGRPDHGFRVFDISVDGVYLDWDAILAACGPCGVHTVPLLYVGPYHAKLVEELTYGPTVVSDAEDIRSKFKGREGVVVTSLYEQVAPRGGRMIVKSVSADYRDRKGAKDIA